jgi:hypothetical protein
MALGLKLLFIPYTCFLKGQYHEIFLFEFAYKIYSEIAKIGFLGVNETAEADFFC